MGTVEGVAPQGEAGLLGLAVSPSYAEDGLVYAYLSTAEDNRVVTMTYDGRSGRCTRAGADRHPQRLHPRRGAVAVRARRQPVRVHRGDRPGPARPGPRLARREDPADHSRRQAGTRQPAEGLAGLDDGAPQRAGARLRRRRPAVGHRVRQEHLGRAEPDREGSQLRLAARGGQGRRPGLPQPVRAVAHLRGVAVRPRLPRRLAVGRRAARRPALAGAGHGRRHRHATGLAWSATTADCARSWPRRTATCG